MSPPTPPRSPVPQLTNAKGQPIDAHGRRLDTFGRPKEDRIIEGLDEISFGSYTSLIIGYPSLGDWTAMFDPRRNRTDAANQSLYDEFKERHQKQITKILKEIASRETGQALLKETDRTPRTITILPIDFVSSSDEWVKYHNNAIASPDSAVRSTYPKMYAGDSQDGKVLKGKGTGSNSQVFFTPDRVRPGGPGHKSDEILFHELVHAVRDTQGASTSGFKMGAGYDNAEEFTAVTVTNVYMSEKGQTDMRGNHGRGTLQDPENFLDSRQVPAPGARMLISLFRGRQPRFFVNLAAIDAKTAKFNPFRQLNEETVRAATAHEAKMREFDRRR